MEVHVTVVFSFQDSSRVAAEEPNDQDVVLIKEETAKEELNGHEAAAELLLNEDGKRGNTPSITYIYIYIYIYIYM